jgi:hypothetical protein
MPLCIEAQSRVLCYDGKTVYLLHMVTPHG